MARLTTFESPFQVTLKGVAAGLVGTLVMTTALQAATRLIEWSAPVSDDDKDDLAAIAELADLDAAAQPSPSTPTERVAERLANTVFNRELSHETRQRLGLGIYWAYGAFWGALSAQIQLRFRLPSVPYGIGLGLVVWLIGPGRIIPALRLYQRPVSSGIGRRLLAISLHMLYGLTAAVTLDRIKAPVPR